MAPSYRDRNNYGKTENREPQPDMIEIFNDPVDVNLVSNVYKCSALNNMTFYVYTVNFSPDVRSSVKYDRFKRFITHNGWCDDNVYYDGESSVISKDKFENIELEIPMREGTAKCTLSYRNTYKSEDMQENSVGLKSCMEIITRSYQRENFYVDRRRMISPNSASTKFSAGLTAIPGLSSTILFTQKDMYLNLDAAFGIFYTQQPVIELIAELSFSNRNLEIRNGEFTPELRSMSEKFLSKVKVRTTHRGEKNRIFTCNGLTLENASSKIIEFTDGKKMSVEEYFRETYFPLKYPKYPLMIFKVKSGMEVHMPMEVLEIVGSQKYKSKLNDQMTVQMIKLAATRPHQRFALIEEKAKELQAINNSNMKSFGLTFDANMANCKGKVLPVPKLRYKKGLNDVTTVKPTKGSWNLRDVKAISPAMLTNWKIFTFSQDHKLSNRQLGCFIDTASSYGLDLVSGADSDKQPISLIEQEVVTSVAEFHKAAKADFNLVILPNSSSIRYGDIKKAAETYKDGVITQCLLAKNIEKLTNPMFAANLMLKFNVKGGGINWILDEKIFADKATMIFGIDVSHPGPSEVDAPTLTAVVGSMDYNFVTFRTVGGPQPARTESVLNLASYVSTMIKQHTAINGKAPERLVFFRDAICDSVTESVASSELAALKNVCVSLDKTYNPEIVYVTVNGRHNVRFSAINKDNTLVNVHPGTMVSDLSDNNLDFYFVSHCAIKGTAKPVRYKTILNESNFTKDDLSKSIYGLCHLYAKATKSVGVVPVIYYATLYNARTKAYQETRVIEGETKVVVREPKVGLSNRLYYI